ncbi:YbdK family carboxylate-amine ligase [Nocardia sp. NPDC058058]|uniref:carboxylate-amine ligase n=1 Tax=Nocardia sp. NPDC058058 TaxID=3346317 RepID=UPI0036D7CC3A
MRAIRTVGFEEEFLLVGPEGEVLASSGAVLSWLHANLDASAAARFKPELQLVQVEAVSEVHTDMSGLRDDVVFAREQLAAAGDACEVAVLPIGTAPLDWHPPTEAAIPGRYARIHDRFEAMMRGYTACGAHVHVGVESPDLAVAVVNHLRPWLPTLIALGANSPFHGGRDTGFASWRVAEQSRFPGFGLPPFARSADDYDDRIAVLIDCGVLVDDHMSFWLARPSDAYPTVEIRAVDACASVDDAILQAVLSRGLVQTALGQLAAGIEGPRFDAQLGAAAVWSAARYGLDGPAVDPVQEIRVPAIHLLDRLLDWITPGLEELGDMNMARGLLNRVRRMGTGADRQRVAARSGLAGVVDLLRLEGSAVPEPLVAGGTLS